MCKPRIVYSCLIHVRPTQKARIKAIAAKRGVNMTDVVEKALDSLRWDVQPSREAVAAIASLERPVPKPTGDKNSLARVCAAALRSDPTIAGDVAKLLSA